jgi:hypothetical protein
VELDFVGHDTSYPWCPGGSFQGYLEELAQSTKNQLHFHGRMGLKDVHELAQACDLAVIPSRVETFCQAAHELNWMGIPLVISDIPPFRDHFQDGVNARIIPSRDDGLTEIFQQIYQKGEIDFCPEWNAPEIIKGLDTVAVYAQALEKFAPQEIPSPENSPLPCRALVLMPQGEEPHPETKASLEKLNGSDMEVNFLKDPIRGLTDLSSRQKPAGQEITPQEFDHGLVVLLKNGDVLDKEFFPLVQRAFNLNSELAALTSFRATGNDASAAPLPWDETLLIYGEPFPVYGSVFRESFLKEQLLDPAMGALAGWDLWLKLAERNLKVGLIPRVLIRNQKNYTGISQQQKHSVPSYLLTNFINRHRDFFTKKVPHLVMAMLNKDSSPQGVSRSKTFVIGHKLAGIFRRVRLLH